MKTFISRNESAIADDHEQWPVFLARNAWHLNDTQDSNKSIHFLKTRE